MIKQTKKPFVLTIFGASGDLAKLKLFPAIYDLAAKNHLPSSFYLIGFARSKFTQSKFKKLFLEAVRNTYPKAKKSIIDSITKNLHYFQGQYTDKQDFIKLKEFIKKTTSNKRIPSLAYLSVPPTIFQDIIKNLGETKNKTEDLRLIVEKPFGEDTTSATELFHFVARYFDEEEVYLLDHYLGKTAVQSILNLRHHNRLLNLMLKGPAISNIQITAAEKVGVTERIGYFDKVGTIKDMLQSHLLQILALITMSIPITEKYQSLSREKISILSALNFIASKRNLVTGQYQGYKNEKKVPKDSKTETFAALRLFIDRESWYRVPIYIRTGKQLHKKHTYIVIELKKFAFQSKQEPPNRVIFELYPNEQLKIKVINKHQQSIDYNQLTTTASIACTHKSCLSEHGLLLLDVLGKNRNHFLNFQEIIATWRITDKITKFIKTNKIKPELYKKGSSGPQTQKKLTSIDGHNWYDIK